MTCGIYKLTSPDNKCYIGKSKNIELRWNKYKFLKCKNQPKLYDAFIKFGVDNFKFEIIYSCDENLLNDKEIFYIKEYNSRSQGYNCTDGGDGITMTNEIRSKISTSLKSLNIKRTKEHIEIIKNNLCKNAAFLKQQEKGKIFSEETRKKLKDKAKTNNGMKNKVYTQEELQYIKQVRRKTAEKYWYKFISPIGEIFTTNKFREFLEQHNLHIRSVRRVIAKEQPHHRGWVIEKILLQ